MHRIGVDLKALTEDLPKEPPPPPDCPGARLRISRDDYDSLIRGGERFATARQDIPFNALGDARIRCSSQVAKLPSTAAGHTQYYGLCHSCSGLEADNRANLRERASKRGDR